MNPSGVSHYNYKFYKLEPHAQYDCDFQIIFEGDLVGVPLNTIF